MKALIAIIDGMNPGYIASETMPYLNDLHSTSNSSTVVASPTFANRLEIMTGLVPKSTSSLVSLEFDRNRSQFSAVPRIPALHTGHFPAGLLFSLARFLRTREWLRFRDMSLFTAYILLTHGAWVDLPRIPLRLLSEMTISDYLFRYQRKEKLGSPDLLPGILERAGLKTTFIYGSAQKITDTILAGRMDKFDVLMIHYGDTDSAGHRYGPGSLEVKEALLGIDKSLQSVIGRMGSDIDLVAVFGDHDMLSVTKQIDILSLMRPAVHSVRGEIAYIVNGSLMRAICETKRAQDILEAFLSSLPHLGRIVSISELDARELPSGKAYGDLVFWAHPGVYFWPNYFHPRPFKGMHTYFDHESRVPLIISAANRKFALRPRGRLIDVLPTLLELLDINTPKIDGHSLVAR